MLYSKPICDKCGGSEFDVTCLDEFTANPVPASQYFSSENMNEGVPAVMIYHNYQAICKDCGAKYEYTA